MIFLNVILTANLCQAEFDITEFDGTAECRLLDAEGNVVAQQTGENTVSFKVANAVKWNCEKPYLYKLELLSKGEKLSFDVGFVEYGVNERSAFIVNGVESSLYRQD